MLLADFESRSRCDLRKRGGRNYWEDPSSEPLCCWAWDTESGELLSWHPGDPTPAWAHVEIVAHNAEGFDRHAGAAAWGVDRRQAWIDSSELARRAGLPGALDALGTRWLGIPKDKAASRFTTGLSTVRRPSGKGPDAISPDDWGQLTRDEKRILGRLPEITPAVMARVDAYCVSDVEILAHGWDALEPWIDGCGEFENTVLDVDHTINDRGIAFDLALARRLLECDDKLTDDACRAAARIVGETPAAVRRIANSPAELAARLGTADCEADTIKAILKASPSRVTKAWCEARQATASILRGKLRAGLDRVSPDGRLRDTHRYYGAHTGRFSHRGMQLGNLTRPAKRFEKWADREIEAEIARVMAGGWCDQETLVVLLRACLMGAPGKALVSCDFSGVEARALAWAADDRKALDVFASGVSPYIVMAAMIFGVPVDSITKGDPMYTLGKIAELACGYGMGADHLYDEYGPSLDAAGVSAAAVIDAWRTLHRPSVEFWYALDAAWIAAADMGHDSRVSCFEIVACGDGAVAIVLPSGRPIMYNEARVSYAPDKRGRLRPRGSYLGTKSGREWVYGGKLAENAIQAMCRDLMAVALVKTEAAGLPPVLHVHDDITSEVDGQAAPEAYGELQAIMCDLPGWARGFPIGAEGHDGRRLRK